MVGWGCSAVYCATPILTKSFHFGIPLWITRLYTIHPRPTTPPTLSKQRRRSRRGGNSSPRLIKLLAQSNYIDKCMMMLNGRQWYHKRSLLSLVLWMAPLSFLPGKWACGLYIVLQETVSVPDKLFLALRNGTEKRTERPAHESSACHSWYLASPIWS